MSKSDEVYHYLRAQIECEAVPPGYHLVVQSLAQTHGVSALPVREALRRLQAEGMVTYANHVGAKVAPVDFVRDAQLFETLGVLEGSILSLVAPIMGPQGRQEWRRRVQELARVVENRDLPSFYTAHQEIIDSWHAACPNRVTASLAEEVGIRLYRGAKNVVLWAPRTADTIVEAHYQALQSAAEGAAPFLLEEQVRKLYGNLANAVRAVMPKPMTPNDQRLNKED